jgi:hypothetical protein
MEAGDVIVFFQFTAGEKFRAHPGVTHKISCRIGSPVFAVPGEGSPSQGVNSTTR